MEPTTNLPHLNYIFAMKKPEQKAYLAAVAEELKANPITHLDREWGIFEDISFENDEDLDAAVRALMAGMTLREKINQMSADIPPKLYKVLFPRYNCKAYYAGEDLKKEIPAIKFTDGPTGIVNGYHSTAFPVPMARGASFDPDLEERIGDAIGIEGRSVGANFFGGVCINLLRHPAWGRAQETYGEDPVLLGTMGSALVRGVQRHMMACTKHFAANSMENARFKVNVSVDERTLHEVYLPHFKRCVEAGTAAIMSAYNRTNNAWCGHNAPLLRNILKEEWGFDGFVMSDFIWGVRDTVDAAQGGLDVEMPVTQYYGALLEEAVDRGDVSTDTIDEAVFRILRTKLKFSKVGEGNYGPERLACEEHCRLSEEAALKSAVLLKNDGILPLKREDLSCITIVGHLAKTPNTGDMKGSSAVFAPYVVTPYDGLKTAIPDVEFLYADGEILDEVTEKSKLGDVVLVFAGLTCKDEGEYILKEGAVGGDRRSIALSDKDRDIIEAATAANKRCIVILQGGSAMITDPWDRNAAALMMTWYAGLEGGTALAKILLGEVTPGGKLPITIPRTQQQLPYFDADAEEITYDRYHGYFLADRESFDVSYPFGFGLSYANITMAEHEVSISGDKAEFRVKVKNHSNFPASEVVQLYVGYQGSTVDRHIKDLKAFKKVYLTAEEEAVVSLSIDKKDLAYYASGQGWQYENITYVGYLGNSSAEKDLLPISFRFDV